MHENNESRIDTTLRISNKVLEKACEHFLINKCTYENGKCKRKQTHRLSLK